MLPHTAGRLNDTGLDKREESYMTTGRNDVTVPPGKRDGGTRSPGSAAAESRKWLALMVLSLAQLMDILDGTIVNIALPTAQADLGFSTNNRQWIITGYALAYGSLLLFAGRLSDRFGRRRLFLIGVVGFGVSSAVCGAANGFEMLLAARIAQGVFAAALAPAALSLVSVTFAHDVKERGRAFSVFGAVSGVGGAVGLVLGGVLTDGLSWRWCLYVNVFFAAVALVGAIVFVRDEGERTASQTLDVPGAAVIATALFGIVYGFSNSAENGWTNAGTLAPLIAGLLLIVVFVVLERRVRQPLLPFRVFLDRNRAASLLAIAFAGIGSFGVFLYLTYYLQDFLGFSPLKTGFSFLPMVAMLVVGAALSGTVLLPRVGPRPIVPTGTVLAAVSLVLLTRIDEHSSYAPDVLPSVLLFGLGFGLIFGAAQNVATAGVDEHDSGVASAMVSTMQQVGGSIGLALFTSISATAANHYLRDHSPNPTLATLYSNDVVYWWAAGLFLLSAVLTAALYRSGPVALDNTAAAHSPVLETRQHVTDDNDPLSPGSQQVVGLKFCRPSLGQAPQ